MQISRIFMLGLIALLTATGARAGEVPIGKLVVTNGMIIGAAYLQAVKMFPQMKAAQVPDIHLEADIHAGENNPYGFEESAWIPYLTIAYVIEKKGSDWKAAGSFMPMSANDGPHYGANVALDGPGKYHLTYVINPPVQAGFAHHVDKETGVPGGLAPLTLQWDFIFVGTGKKGGY